MVRVGSLSLTLHRPYLKHKNFRMRGSRSGFFNSVLMAKELRFSQTEMRLK
jgi:hypothetical protein